MLSAAPVRTMLRNPGEISSTSAALHTACSVSREPCRPIKRDDKALRPGNTDHVKKKAGRED